MRGIANVLLAIIYLYSKEFPLIASYNWRSLKHEIREDTGLKKRIISVVFIYLFVFIES